MAFQEVDEDEAVLTGVASGALAGSAAGPVGAVAGGVIGGLLASFSAGEQNAAAKRAEREKNTASLKASHLRLLARRQTEQLSQTSKNLKASKPSNSGSDSNTKSSAPTGAVGAGLAASSGTF